MAFDYHVPHQFLSTAFGVCESCGMDELEADPVQCDHPYATGPCRECPPLHGPETVVISDEDTGYGANSYFAHAMIRE